MPSNESEPSVEWILRILRNCEANPDRTQTEQWQLGWTRAMQHVALAIDCRAKHPAIGSATPTGEPSIEWTITKREESNAAHPAPAPQWSSEWPTEPGWYWCHVANRAGQRWTHLLQVVAVRGFSNTITVTSGGSKFIVHPDTEHWWLPATIPAPPTDAATTVPAEAAPPKPRDRYWSEEMDGEAE